MHWSSRLPWLAPLPAVRGFNRGRAPTSERGLAVAVGREGELDVGTSDGDERAGLRRAAVQRRELRVDQGDEVQVAAVQVVGEAAAVALLRQRQVADDPLAVGLQHHAFDPGLHTVKTYRPGGHDLEASERPGRLGS